MTEKILRKMIAFVIAAAFILPLMMPQVFAASTVTISTKDTIEGGETFNVAVSFGGGDVGRVNAQLTYDTEMMSYLSGGTSTGDTGYVQLKDAGTDGSVVFNLQFQAIAEGNVMLDVTTFEMYDLDGQQIDNPSSSKSITIEGNAAEEEIVETTAPEEEQTETAAPEQEPIVLEGVDEKYAPKIITIAIIAAAVLLLLIIIISIALKKSRKPKKAVKAASMAAGAVHAAAGKGVPAADIDDPASGDRYEESLEGPNPLRNYKNPYEVEKSDKELEEELQRRREEIRQQRYEQRIAARERAKAQTQLWDAWTLDDDDKKDSDDIEKW